MPVTFGGFAVSFALWICLFVWFVIWVFGLVFATCGLFGFGFWWAAYPVVCVGCFALEFLVGVAGYVLCVS